MLCHKTVQIRKSKLVQEIDQIINHNANQSINQSIDQSTQSIK